MPRPSRLVLPAVPLHLIQRGHNRQPCFLNDDDHLAYRGWLLEHARQNHCRVHAYVLMGNHVHLLVSVVDAAALARMMKAVAQNYARHFNDRHLRNGAVWQGRYNSHLVQSEDYFLACQRYVELNPVRAGLVAYPGNYRWSSYRCNAEGRHDELVTPHALYERLGLTAAARRQAYRGLFDEAMGEQVLERIRCAARAQRTL